MVGRMAAAEPASLFRAANPAAAPRSKAQSLEATKQKAVINMFHETSSTKYATLSAASKRPTQIISKSEAHNMMRVSWEAMYRTLRTGSEIATSPCSGILVMQLQP